MLSPRRLLRRSQSLASVLLSGGVLEPPLQSGNRSKSRSYTYYDVLGVPRASSTDDIKSAFRTVRRSPASFLTSDSKSVLC